VEKSVQIFGICKLARKITSFVRPKILLCFRVRIRIRVRVRVRVKVRVRVRVRTGVSGNTFSVNVFSSKCSRSVPQVVLKFIVLIVIIKKHEV